MARIKHTKNELKAQRDALRRFERYLPTLLLKKQQLQLEVRQLDLALDKKRAEQDAVRAALAPWIRLFAEAFPFGEYLRVVARREAVGNIAGVAIPVLEALEFERRTPDLFDTPPWVDDGLVALEKTARLRIELVILEEQRRRLAEELRTTTQRVNLFEKVKIPEAKDHIRVIRIFLGDQMTAEVARSKIAKGKSTEKERAA
jgi:V/A-type H+/Na+-transporting ATPase subunit D